MNHHGCSRTSRAGITISTRNLLRSGGWQELRMSPWVHHLRARNHSLWSWHELRLHHHLPSHLSLLRRHVLWVVGEAAELTHLRRSRSHKYWLIVLHLRGGVICDRNMTEPRRCEGLSRVGVHHAMIVVTVRGMRHRSMLWCMHLHRRHMW